MSLIIFYHGYTVITSLLTSSWCLSRWSEGSSNTRIGTFRNHLRHINPVQFWLSSRLNNLGGYDDFLLHNNETSIITILFTVVCAWCDSDELSSGKSVKASWAYLMWSENHAHTIVFKELLHSIRSKLHDVVLSHWISNSVSCDTKLFFVISGITPQ